MKSFLNGSACNGSRPKVAAAKRQFSRPRLMAKLMGERGVARFLVAPTGFGKTTLALEYAESIFGFRNVYWIKCQSPCFLRDLDSGIISAALRDSSEDHALVVFEDVPLLDEARAQTFSDDINALLSGGWEILVTMTPAFDAFADLQTDRVLLRAQDFLVDNSELLATGCSSLRDASKADRVASFVWGESQDIDRLLGGMKSAETPTETQLALFVMLVLQEGGMDEVLAFAHGLKKEARAFVGENYPYAGVDLINDLFNAHDFSINQIKAAFGDAVNGLARCSSSTLGRDVFVARLAGMLLAKKRLRRAAELMRVFCGRKKRMAWVEEVQGLYFDAGHVLAVHDLFESFGVHVSGLTPELMLGAAERLYVFGDAEGARTFALRILGGSDRSDEVLCAAALLLIVCSGSDGTEKPMAVLRGLAEKPEQGGTVLSALAAFGLFLQENPSRALDAIEGCEEAFALSRGMMICLAFALSRVDAWGDAGNGRVWSASEARRIVGFSRQCLAVAREGHDSPRLADALVRDALVTHAGERMEASEWGMESDTLMFFVERQRRIRASREKPERFDVRSESVGGLAAAEGAYEMVPEMHVRLFGGMEVRIGNRVLDPNAFSKQKAKTLLAVLVLHRGKEIPRSELLEIMWPLAPGDKAINNFYSLWSTLKKALRDERGECPYLVRHQMSCMLDSRYVKSDVEEFDALCRRLFFESPNPAGWLEVFGRLQDEFSSALLPSETENTYIVAARERLRLRLVDAYVAASMRLCDVREAQAALWFAKAALEIDQEREDAYYALAQAQMMTGQRTLAMETCHACRDRLREELGIDPSERMDRLYLKLLNGPDVDFSA